MQDDWNAIIRASVALLLLAGWLHGAGARLPDVFRPGAELGPAGLIGPLELLVLGIAVFQLRHAPPRWAAGWQAGAFALALLVPSTLAGNAALLLFALWIAARAGAQARSGALLFAGLAACGLWWVVGERLAGGAPLRADAAAVEHILRLVMPEVQRDGNVVGVPEGHRIVVLAGCSTLNGLPLTLLGLAALCLRGGRLPRGFRWRALLAMLLYAVANLARLTLLGVSDAAYRAGHGAYGQSVFDALVTLLPLALAKRESSAEPPPPAPDTPPAAWRMAVLAALCAAGLALMAAQLRAPAVTPREVAARAAAGALLARFGWRVIDEATITGDGANTVTMYSHAGCPAPLALAVVPRPSEAAAMVQAALGSQTRWLEAGTLYDAAPLTLHTWHELRAAALARLTGRPDRSMPLLAVSLGGAASGPGCPVPQAGDWQALATLPR